MADYQLVARNGVKRTEDDGAEEVIIEAGPHNVINATATDTLSDDEAGSLVHNKGAAGNPDTRVLTLHAPGAAGGIPTTFADLGAGLRILAPATKQIRVGDQQCIAGGYIESRFAQMFRIWSLDGNEFMVEGNPDNFLVQTS